jgi:hypothetical protein
VISPQKQSALVLRTEEQLIDAGLGTPEMIARDQARTAELEAWRRSRPLSYRMRQGFWRRVAMVAGVIAGWAERAHDDVHPSWQAGCAGCELRDRRMGGR